MSEKKRIKWKLNLFDIGLLVVVLAVAVGLVAWKFIGSNQTQVDPESGVVVPKGTQPIRYVVELEQVHKETADMVKVGQELYERTRKELMGTVESVEVTPTEILTRNETAGIFEYVKMPERYNVVMEISTQATESENNIVLASGLEIRAGTSVRVLGPGYYGAGYVLSVERG